MHKQKKKKKVEPTESALEQLSNEAKMKNTTPTKSILWNDWPSLGLENKYFNN